jgi:hypothetical protein
MFIPVGLLVSGGDNLRVAQHIWVGSKASWELIGDNGIQHLEGYRAEKSTNEG